MDLLGPTRTENISGNKYIWVIVDRYFRFAWVVNLEQRVMPSLILRYLIRRIKNDRGREFDNFDFLEFCHTLGIKHKFFCF